MIFQGENLLVGLVALALLPLIGWRIWRGKTRWQVRTCYRPKWLNPWTKHDNIRL